MESDEKEPCGAPHPWMPHRTCQRPKGHGDAVFIRGIPIAAPTHADYAGSWRGEGQPLKGPVADNG